MAELAFTKSFLSTLDSKPVKLRADHVFDPERVGLRVPYTLPKLSNAHPEMPKKTKQRAAPGQSKSIRIQLKSARNPALEVTLPNAAISTTSVVDLKDAVRERVVDAFGGKVSLEKIKILWRRKPVTGKTVGEILGDEPDLLAGGREVEFGVMIIGGAQVVETDAHEHGIPETSRTAAGEEEILETEAFWDDLQGFLQQRLKDDGQATRLRVLFKNAWSASR